MKVIYVGLALAVLTLSGCDTIYQFLGVRTESEDNELAYRLDVQDRFCRTAPVEEYFKHHCKEHRHQDRDHDRDQP